MEDERAEVAYVHVAGVPLQHLNGEEHFTELRDPTGSFTCRREDRAAVRRLVAQAANHGHPEKPYRARSIASPAAGISIVYTELDPEQGADIRKLEREAANAKIEEAFRQARPS